jgi:hypothetical protein
VWEISCRTKSCGGVLTVSAWCFGTMRVDEIVAVRSHTRRRASSGNNGNKSNGKAHKFTDTSYTPPSKYKPFNKPVKKPTPFNKPKPADLS